MGVINYMPLVHEARRAVVNEAQSNPFMTKAYLTDLLERLTTAYLSSKNDRMSQLLHIELITVEELEALR